VRSLKIVDDAEELARTAAEELLLHARGAVETAGVFRIGLAGGSTPRSLYRLLAGAGDPTYRETFPWRETEFFMGDERAVPPDHADSNYRMIREELFSKVPVRPDQVCRFRSELPDVQEVVSAYEKTLRRFFRTEMDEIPCFDLMLLGLGADGHTASLFPGTEVVHERDRLAAAPWVRQLHAHRFTLTPPVFNHAALLMFLVSGPEKAEAVRDVLEGNHDPERLPAQVIHPENGTVRWLLDQAAASMLSSRR